MDGGPISIKERTEVIARAKTIMWNGPTGVIEFPQFRKSSSALLRDIIEQTKKGATSVVGGGDSVSLVHAENAEDKLSHVSTGGGASLELMEGTELPGVKHLTDVDKIKWQSCMMQWVVTTTSFEFLPGSNLEGFFLTNFRELLHSIFRSHLPRNVGTFCLVSLHQLLVFLAIVNIHLALLDTLDAKFAGLMRLSCDYLGGVTTIQSVARPGWYHLLSLRWLPFVYTALLLMLFTSMAVNWCVCC